MKRLCSIYRCAKKEGMYVYVDKTQGLEAIPEPLFKQLGNTELAMTLLIDKDKKLARANAEEVLQAIAADGFYLQMPPVLHTANAQEMSALREQNTKL